MPPPRKPAKLPAGYCYRSQKRKKPDGTSVLVRSPLIYRRVYEGKSVKYVNTGCTTLDALGGWMANEVRERELGAVGLSDPLKAAKSLPALKHLADYLEVVRESSRCEQHHWDVERAVTRVFVGCEIRTLRDIDPRKIHQHLAARTCSAATKNKARSYFYSFCKWLVQGGRLAANPVDQVKPFKVKLADAAAKRRRRAYTVSELKSLVATAATFPLDSALKPRGGRPRRDGTAVRYKAGANSLDPATVDALKLEGQGRQLLYRTLISTGLRRGELSRVTVTMFDPKRRTLSLPGPATKNGRPAVIRLPARLADDLHAYASVRGRTPSEALLSVPDVRSLVHVHQRNLKAAGVVYKTEAGFADIHAMRKTANSYLRKHGVSARLRQRFLRHAAADLMTAVYDDERGTEMKPVVKLMARLDALLVAGIGRQERDPLPAVGDASTGG